MEQKVVSMIPARGGSKGIRQKNLALLNGKPLIYYTIDASRKALKISETWVNTDNDDIAEYAKSQSVYTYRRPPILASDTASLDDVLIDFAWHIDFDVVVLIQPTSPMLLPSDLDAGVGLMDDGLINNNWLTNTVISVAIPDDMLIWNMQDKKPMNYDTTNRGIRQDRKLSFVIETGGFYITTKASLLEKKCRIGSRIEFSYVPFWRMFEVDTQEDLIMIERLMKYT